MRRLVVWICVLVLLCLGGLAAARIVGGALPSTNAEWLLAAFEEADGQTHLLFDPVRRVRVPVDGAPPTLECLLPETRFRYPPPPPEFPDETLMWTSISTSPSGQRVLLADSRAETLALYDPTGTLIWSIRAASRTFLWSSDEHTGAAA